MIAQAILQQIGGRRFVTMTGSRDFINMGNGLRMSLAKNKTSANRIDITYDEGLDLYNMRFYRKTFNKKDLRVQDKGDSRLRGCVLRYAGEHLHAGDGILYTLLSGGGFRRPTFFR